MNVSAQVTPALDRFSLSVSAFSSAPQVSANVASDHGAISTGNLDAQRKSMPRVSGEFLLGGNHGISFDAYKYREGHSSHYAWDGYRSKLAL